MTDTEVCVLGNLHYLIRLGRAILVRSGRAGSVPARRAPVAFLALGLSLVALAAVADHHTVAAAAPRSATFSEMRARTTFVSNHLAGLATDREREIEPIVRALLEYREDPVLARRIALALVREGRQTNIDPRMLLAVLLVENPWLDADARSSVGAVGLMQVMPFHAGEWEPCSDDLEDIDTNICYGARIFAHYLGATNGDLDRALLRYNGCVRGTNTPDCDRYPTHVFARAGRATLWNALTRSGVAASR